MCNHLVAGTRRDLTEEIVGSQRASAKAETAMPSGSFQGGAPVVALTTTLALAAVSWVVALREMRGMDMGVATTLGSFAFFAAAWMWMMAAMMLPGAAPAIVRRIRAAGGFLAWPLFVVSYLAVWAV